MEVSSWHLFFQHPEFVNMGRLSFLFLTCLYFIIPIFSLIGPLDIVNQVICSTVLIILFGIPHGAIDHIIFLEENRVKTVHFYLLYIGMMGIYIVGWIMFSVLSLIFFLGLSAFHFGQSQFSDFASIPKFRKIILSFAWGSSILAGLIYYNNEEILFLSKSSPEISPLLVAFDIDYYQVLLPVSTIITLILMSWSAYRKELSREDILKEMYIFGLIHLCFYVLPVLIGFTLYFTILHSIKVLKEEYNYLHSRRTYFSINDFIKLLLPYTLVSIAGALFIFYLSSKEIIGISSFLLVFILISILTLPHSIVMDAFYKKRLNEPSF